MADARGPRTIEAETWARTAARLLKRSPAEAQKILEEAGIDFAVWREWNAHYRKQMAREFESGTLQVARLYAASCSEEMQRRKGPLENEPRGSSAAVKTQPMRALEPVGALAETSPVDGLPRPTEELPFRQHGSVVPPPAMVSFEPNPALGQTAEGATAGGPALPFSGARGLPMSSVDVYAYLCAARELSPEHAQRACAEFGLDMGAQSELDLMWSERFNGDAALLQRFLERLTHERDRGRQG